LAPAGRRSDDDARTGCASGSAFRIAGLYWSKKGLNELADQATDDAFREITRRINGGFNGLADRQQFYATARATLGVTSPPVAQDMQRLPAPNAPEPVFERGFEAIRAARRRRRRKPAPARRARKTRKVTRAKKTGPSRRTRKAAPARRTQKKKSKR
jgi:hypothetical protein